jgi:hypothetical protein
MTKAFYFPLIAVAILFAMGWFVQGHFSHISGRTLILSTTKDEERKKIQTELVYIANHRPDFKLSEKKPVHTLASLQKVSTTPFITDSSQIRDALDLSTTWNTWKVRQVNARLVSEPVYVVHGFKSDTTRR